LGSKEEGGAEKKLSDITNLAVSAGYVRIGDGVYTCVGAKSFEC
jgi:hypothetical protein